MGWLSEARASANRLCSRCVVHPPCNERTCWAQRNGPHTKCEPMLNQLPTCSEPVVNCERSPTNHFEWTRNIQRTASQRHSRGRRTEVSASLDDRRCCDSYLCVFPGSVVVRCSRALSSEDAV